MTKKEAVKAAERAAKKTKTVYIGPTITGVATRNTVYDDVPEELNKVVKALPYMAGLCIPFSGLGKAMTQIQQQAGHSYTLFCKAQEDSAKIQEIVQKEVI